jgi:pimeloyl-ACP methyl ester carboxylesterase
MGSGAWSRLSEQARKTFVFNAPTWLDETRDPEALEIDLDELHRFAAPALLTTGDQSPSYFPLVVDRIAAAIPTARIRTYQGSGHVPYRSHPDEYVRVIGEFIRSSF